MVIVISGVVAFCNGDGNALLSSSSFSFVSLPLPLSFLSFLAEYLLGDKPRGGKLCLDWSSFRNTFRSSCKGWASVQNVWCVRSGMVGLEVKGRRNPGWPCATRDFRLWIEYEPLSGCRVGGLSGSRRPVKRLTR